MSKVYSFRLDDNNPREAQARDVIDAWVSDGYSLRQKLVEILIGSYTNECQDSVLKDVLEKITHLLGSTNEGDETVKVVQDTLPEAFVGAISMSVKSGIRME